MKSVWRSAAWMTAYLLAMVVNGCIIIASFIYFGLYAIPMAILSLYVTMVFCMASLERT